MWSEKLNSYKTGPDENGRFGNYGGMFVSETLMPLIIELKVQYEKAGYDFPKIVFWDLNAHQGQQAQCSDENVAMVSGFSPSIMKAILNAEEFNPMDVMLEALKPIELDYTNLKDNLDIDYEEEI